MITLKLETKGVETKLNNAKKEVAQKMVNELNRFALLTQGDAMRLAPVDEGQLKRSIGVNRADLNNIKASVVVAANYASYVEFGTRAFAAAYVSTLPANWQTYAAKFRGSTGGSYDDFILRLMGWMKRKGIDEKAAYSIAKKILRNGIRPQPFLFPAVTRNFEELKKRLKA